MDIALNKTKSCKAEGKQKTAATASHMLRTPITCILGFSHLLNSTKLTVEQKEYLQNINQATYQLLAATKRLIDDLELKKHQRKGGQINE